MATLNREFWALTVFAGISFAYASWLRYSILWFLFYLCFSCIVVALIYRWRNWRSIKIHRFFGSELVPGAVEAGADINVRIGAETSGRLPWPWLRIQDTAPSTLRHSVTHETGGHLAWFQARAKQWVTYRLENVPRGIHRWDSVQLDSADPLGLVSFSGYFQDPGQLVVYPRTVNLSAMTYFPIRQEGVVSSKSLNQDLAQLVGIREYRPGDRLSLIHWKSTAKTGELHTKEFAPLLVDSSLVVLDCSVTAWQPGKDPSFEEAVIVATSLVKAAWLQRIPVRFYGNQRWEHNYMPVQSRGEYHRFLYSMATISPVGRHPLSHSLLQQLSQGSNVVVVTSRAGSKLHPLLYQLAARGNAVTAIHIDAQQQDVKYQRPRSSGGFLNIISISKADDLTPRGRKRNVV